MGKLGIQKEDKKYLFDVLLCIFLYLFAVSLPAPSFLTQQAFTGAMRFLFLIPIAWLLITDGFKLTLGSIKGVFLCLPMLLIAFGNMTSLWARGQGALIEGSEIERLALFTFGTALIEEVVFRLALMQLLAKTSLKRFDVLISAAIFGLCHIFALLSGSGVLPVLQQVGYTFALGLLLGVAYKYGGLIAPFLIHFAFNFFQTDLYLSADGGSWDALFFALNIGFYVFSFGYAFFLMWKGGYLKEILHRNS